MEENQFRRFSPVRSSVGNVRRGNYWEAYSPKIHRTVRLYSTLEYHHWLTVEADPEIVYFEEQPGLFQVGEGEGRLMTRPDMLVLYRDERCELREVKPMEALVKANPKVLRQIAALKACSVANGALHRVIHSQHLLEKRVLIQNWQIGVALLRVCESVEQERQRILLEDTIKATGLCTIGQLVSLKDRLEQDLIQHVFCAAFLGRIQTDLDQQPLSRRTKVWVS